MLRERRTKKRSSGSVCGLGCTAVVADILQFKVSQQAGKIVPADEYHDLLAQALKVV